MSYRTLVPPHCLLIRRHNLVDAVQVAGVDLLVVLITLSTTATRLSRGFRRPTLHLPLHKTPLFFEFPYVCPDPVLVK